MYRSSSSAITMGAVSRVIELYADSLRVYAHTRPARRYRSPAFHDRADPALAFLVRNCPRLRVLAVHERVSAATLLVVAREGRESARDVGEEECSEAAL